MMSIKKKDGRRKTEDGSTYVFGLRSSVQNYLNSYRTLGLSFSIILLIFSCNPPKYPGFSETTSGLFYKIHVIGDGKTKIQKGDFVKFSERVKFMNDSVKGEIHDSTLQITEIIKGNLTECFLLLSEGDSATFIINDSCKYEVKIQKIQSLQQYEEEQKYLLWKNDGEMNELKKLKDFLNKKNIDNRYLTDGIYFIPVKKGKGNVVEIGNTVVVHYKGGFPDSTIFDSTYEKKEPFEFKFGDDDQVIKGLELAICQMKKGEKAKIIIPSQLAFGESGSSTGIVPPFTTVEYEVEIVNLK